jgi:hypothetical protein
VYANATDSRDLEVGRFAVSPSKLISISFSLAGTAYFRTSKLIACVACIVGTAIVISRDEVFFAAVVACIVGIACTVGTVFVASRDDVFFAAAIVIAFWDGFLVVGVCGVACIVGTIFVDVACIVSTVVIIIHSSDAACIVGIVVIIPSPPTGCGSGSYLSSSSLSAFP